jgi:hypothetical protein
MGSSALVGFRIGTTFSFVGDVFYIKKRGLIFGMPDTRMSSIQLFQRFAPEGCLTSLALAYQMP